MNTPLALAFLFSLGAVMGWCIEFLFRNLISHKGPRGKYFINPGLCRGPWLPIYGIGVAIMFVITYIVTESKTGLGALGNIGVILAIMLCMTVIELVGGIILLKFLNLRLWDYRSMPGNFMGIICPTFTLIWGAIGAVYYLFIHRLAIDAIIWLSNNLAFSFFVGLFLGVFMLDLTTSIRNTCIIKKFGDDHEVIVKYEELKDLIQKKLREEGQKGGFLNQTNVDSSLRDVLEEHPEATEDKKDAFKSKTKHSR